jgi:hypothetical protein
MRGHGSSSSFSRFQDRTAMSNAVSPSEIPARRETVSVNNIRLDFEMWLISLQSGNLLAAKTAFKALKKDFENSGPEPTRQASDEPTRLGRPVRRCAG